MLGSFHNIERIYRNGFRASVTTWTKQTGLELNLYRKTTPDEFERVYGVDAGEADTISHKLVGLVVDYQLTPIDTLSFGTFSEGYLYTDETDLAPGDIIEIVRLEPDQQSRKYTIVREESSGHLYEVFKRWALSSVNN